MGWVTFARSLAPKPEKTFIGRIEKGFDFLGYHFSRAELTVARATLENFVARANRLYEQERGKQDGFPRLGEYMRRWSGWARAGLPRGANRRASVLGHCSIFRGTVRRRLGSLPLRVAGCLDVEVQQFYG